jgi:hypothetical protein
MVVVKQNRNAFAAALTCGAAVGLVAAINGIWASHYAETWQLA